MSNVKERPIIFDAASVLAILRNEKSQTRRLVKPQPELGKPWKYGWIVDPECMDVPLAYCPYGVIGDRLYAKEVWRAFIDPDSDEPSIEYRADGALVTYPEAPAGRWDDVKYEEWQYRINEQGCADCEKAGIVPNDEGAYIWKEGKCPIRWRSGRFMPRWASRILLEVTERRIQRIQDISAEDVEAEGINVTRHWPLIPPVDLSDEQLDALILRVAHRLMKKRWDSLYAAKGHPFDANDWVWAISFRRVE